MCERENVWLRAFICECVCLCVCVCVCVRDCVCVCESMFSAQLDESRLKKIVMKGRKRWKKMSDKLLLFDKNRFKRFISILSCIDKNQS